MKLTYLYKLLYLGIIVISLFAVQSCSSDDNEETLEPTQVNGHEVVDLGLSVKWATCNIGAATPTECGNYYAWGETTTKNNYDWETYKWCNGDRESLTKYCTNSEYGDTDGLTVLSSSDDVATVKWGNKWRTPTKKEYEELFRKCKVEWTKKSNVNGCLVTGPSGKSIFLPAAGSRSRTDLRNKGIYGPYLTATLDSEGDNGCAYTFSFDQNKSIKEWGIFGGLRCFGFPVRAVCE